MERHACKLCFRRFSNGRALGGHMRFHAMANTSRRPTIVKEPSLSPLISSSSSGHLEVDQLQVLEEGTGQNTTSMVAGAGGGGGLGGFQGCYVLRENGKRNFKFTDPEFSGIYNYASVFQVAGVKGTDSETNNRNNNSSSIVVRNRDSETDTSMQTSPYSTSDILHQRAETVENVSSVSDTTPDEDGALSLMMLSRDIWPNNNLIGSGMQREEEEEQQEEEPIVSSSERKKKGSRKRVIKKISGSNGEKKSRYYCEPCNKSFRSYQALGGHRASHKKIPSCNLTTGDSYHRPNDDHCRSKKIRQVEEGKEEIKVKLHECPYCFKVFQSGQALGGHKRSHLVAGHSLPQLPPQPPPPVVAKLKIQSSFLDLNLPAPPSSSSEEEVEVDSSAVSN